MRPSLPFVALTASVLVLSGGAAVAHGGHRPGHGPGHEPGHGTGPNPDATFTVVEHADTDATTDTGPAGDSAGDVLTFANPLFNGKNDHQVGTDNGFCIRTVKGAAYECTWTNTLKLGSITVSGPFYDSGDSVLAITGGTGKYRHASGQMTLHPRNAAGSAYDFTFEVRAPS